MGTDDPAVDQLVERLADVPPVRAVVITGSQASGAAGADSDLDLFVYVDGDIGVERRRLAEDLADRSHPVLVDEDPFGSGDVWRSPHGTWIDAVFWSPTWAEDQLDRVLDRHEASLGYSTAFWRSISSARPLYERDAWHPALQQRAASEYPQGLLDAIVSLNYPWVTDHPFSFRRQIVKAVARRDTVSANHRLAAWMASYFDLLFAVNRVLHPGEKRQLGIAEAECSRLPRGLRRGVTAALEAPDPTDELDRLIEQLRPLL